MLMMSEIKKGIGERLRSARERKGLKQNKVANYLGIHNSTLAKYESGEREPDAETLKKLAEYYEEKIDWIIGNEGQQYADPKMNATINSYLKLPPEKQKLIDELVKTLSNK